MMPRGLKINIIFLLLTWQLNAQVHKLEIKFDSKFHGEALHEFIDNAVLLGSNLSRSIEWTVDTNDNYCKYDWGHLPEGTYKFRINTNFFTKYEITIKLISDTTITINKEQLFDETAYITLADLRENDPVSILKVVSGCFGHSVEKFSLSKSNLGGFNLYGVEKRIHDEDSKWVVTINKTVQLDAIKMLYDMQLELSKIERNGWSTTMQHIYILAGRKLFHFEDTNLPNWLSFKDKFK